MEENGNLVQFIFRGDEVVAEESREDIRRYIRSDVLLVSDAESARTYYHYASDELGSITHVTEGEEVPGRYEYDAWGNVTESQEKVENRFQFNGQQYDLVSQQYYLRARYYNPVIGRFTQEDTYRDNGLNLYVYCANNPVYYVDPSGNACEPAKDRIGASADASKSATKTPTKLDEHQKNNGTVDKPKVPEGYYQDAAKKLGVNTGTKGSGEAINGGLGHENLPVLENGPYIKNGKPNGRPTLSGEARLQFEKEVYNNNVDLDGILRDPNTGDIINWKPGEARKGVVDFGHNQGSSYSEMFPKYKNRQITLDELKEFQFNPHNYRLETPSANQSHLYE